jgi:hypothetical protein
VTGGIGGNGTSAGASLEPEAVAAAPVEPVAPPAARPEPEASPAAQPAEPEPPAPIIKYDPRFPNVLVLPPPNTGEDSSFDTLQLN